MHPATTKAIALTVMSVPMLGFMMLGAAFLLSPHGPATESWHLVGSVADLPEDGTPVLMPVFGKHFDAWTRLPNERISDVFVRKVPETMKVSAALAWHHDQLRIPIRYEQREHKYISVCWNVEFDLQGHEIIGRGGKRVGFKLVMLPVEVENNSIWVCLDSTPI